MQIHADFRRPVLILGDTPAWVSSPQVGVERVMLDRIGEEAARATSLVRYAPNTEFPPHAHPAGEEILVLDGTFSDETGEFPAGWYLRNPPGSRHRPSSRDGALIFVKLRQMADDDRAVVRIDTGAASIWQHTIDGRALCPLHRRRDEQVDLLRLPPGHAVCAGAVDGIELLVIDGSLQVGEVPCRRYSWLRRPAGIHADLHAGPAGALVYRRLGLPGRLAPV